MTEEKLSDLEARIDALEDGYAFMLGYAAQGRDTDAGDGQSGSQMREHLDAMTRALGGFGAEIRAAIAAKSSDAAEAASAFLDAFDQDTERTSSLLRFVSAQEKISSQLISNVISSVHVKAFFTGLFVLHESL